MSKERDIVSELISRIQAAAPGAISPGLLCDIEHDFRHDFGRDKHYVAGNPRVSVEQIQAAVTAFCARGVPVTEAAAMNGISRRTLYRALGSKR
ncbi:protein of unknown function [Georgfuchsia toluolica]|uniref:Uncharacterized protein n=1 Tax=Georgfuchsia toluolica TaxID=424218 RepID=A0A916J5H1_9PROT|nr:protein of unknown function [Georgfuchsia toluolica]